MEQYPECTSLHLDGEIDACVAPRLRECLARVWARTSSPCVIIDLSRVTFCDASGVSALLFAKKSMALAGRRLILTGISRKVGRVLCATGAIDSFEIQQSVEHVLAELAGRG